MMRSRVASVVHGPSYLHGERSFPSVATQRENARSPSSRPGGCSHGLHHRRHREHHRRSSCTTRTTAPGQPVVLIHGYPLDGSLLGEADRALLDAGYRVITYDRRGFGRSSQAHRRLRLRHLRRRPEGRAGAARPPRRRARRLLDGHRRGRPLPRHVRLDAVAKAAFLGSLEPFLLQTDDNPDGVPRTCSTGLLDAVKADRYAFFTEFFDNFFNTDEFLGTRSARRRSTRSWNVAVAAPRRVRRPPSPPGSPTSAPTSPRSTSRR